jgi:Flp pilus assembly protein TadB
MDVWNALFSRDGVAFVTILGGIAWAIFATAQRVRLRELEIRERIAMIERGMVPPPEVDPNGFERRMQTVDHLQHRYAGNRFRSGGIMVISIGFGLMTLLWFVGVTNVALGVGGFLVIIGVGLFVNGLLNVPRPIPLVPPLPPPSSSQPAQSQSAQPPQSHF